MIACEIAFRIPFDRRNLAAYSYKSEANFIPSFFLLINIDLKEFYFCHLPQISFRIISFSYTALHFCSMFDEQDKKGLNLHDTHRVTDKV